MKGFILLSVCYFLLSFAYSEAHAKLSSEEESQTAIRHCSETLPVDLYMKCLEQAGQLPRVGDNTQTIRNKKLQMRQHDELAASNCWRLIEIEDFNKCLNEYIGRRIAARLQIPYDEATLRDELSYNPMEQ